MIKSSARGRCITHCVCVGSDSITHVECTYGVSRNRCLISALSLLLCVCAPEDLPLAQRRVCALPFHSMPAWTLERRAQHEQRQQENQRKEAARRLYNESYWHHLLNDSVQSLGPAARVGAQATLLRQKLAGSEPQHRATTRPSLPAAEDPQATRPDPPSKRRLDMSPPRGLLPIEGPDPEPRPLPAVSAFDAAQSVPEIACMGLSGTDASTSSSLSGGSSSTLSPAGSTLAPSFSAAASSAPAGANGSTASAPASATAAVCANASALGEPVASAILVLGVAFSNEAHISFASSASQKAGLERERSMLLRLQLLAPEQTLITMCDSVSERHCLPNLHLDAAFTEAGYAKLQATLTARNMRLSAIYADYHRYTVEQMQIGYGRSFLHTMLPRLINAGTVGQHTEVLLPNLRFLQQGVTQMLHGWNDASASGTRLECTPIAAGACLLGAAMEGTNSSLPTDARERIEQLPLDAAHRFLRIQLKATPVVLPQADPPADVHLSGKLPQVSAQTTCIELACG